METEVPVDPVLGGFLSPAKLLFKGPQLLRDAVDGGARVVESALAPKPRPHEELVESAERSLRAYESQLMHLEDRFSELSRDLLRAWEEARVEFIGAYQRCSLAMRGSPTRGFSTGAGASFESAEKVIRGKLQGK